MVCRWHAEQAERERERESVERKISRPQKTATNKHGGSRLQILVVAANIQKRTLKTEVEKGSIHVISSWTWVSRPKG